MENDMVFDSEGETRLLKKMIAGGYFFVNGNERTASFFEVNEKYINFIVETSQFDRITGNSQYSTELLCH